MAMYHHCTIMGALTNVTFHTRHLTTVMEAFSCNTLTQHSLSVPTQHCEHTLAPPLLAPLSTCYAKTYGTRERQVGPHYLIYRVPDEEISLLLSFTHVLPSQGAIQAQLLVL